jgi:hypothetical protein
MRWFRRLSVSLGAAVAVASAVTVGTVGAAVGFGSGAGRFTFNDLSANASYFDPVDQSNINISVDRQLFFFRPRAGGPLQGPDLMTVLSVNRFVPNPDPNLPPLVDQSLSAVIPGTDFVVSRDLHTATLNTTVDVGTCFEVVPLTGALPAKSVGGCGTGFTGPVTVSVTWTGTGVVGSQDDNGSSRCGGFVATTHNHSRSAFSANVTATVSEAGDFSGGAPSVFGYVSSSEFVNIVAGSGILSPACGGKG